MQLRQENTPSLLGEQQHEDMWKITTKEIQQFSSILGDIYH